MGPLSPPLEKLQIRDRELKAHIAQLGEMRPGSLVEGYRKCGKPNCHCARPGDRGHGPLWMVTHAAEGKTVSKAIPSGPELDRTRAQIAEYQRFRQLTHALVATNERICDARLEALRGVPSPEIKKNRAGRGVRRGGGARDGGAAGHRRG